MPGSIADNRRAQRQRLDATAFHFTKVDLDAVNTTETIRLDIVARKITVQPVGVTVNVEISLDGQTFVTALSGISVMDTYGDAAGEHLVKTVRLTRTAGTGKVFIAGA